MATNKYDCKYMVIYRGNGRVRGYYKTLAGAEAAVSRLGAEWHYIANEWRQPLLLPLNKEAA